MSSENALIKQLKEENKSLKARLLKKEISLSSEKLVNNANLRSISIFSEIVVDLYGNQKNIPYKNLMDLIHFYQHQIRNKALFSKTEIKRITLENFKHLKK